jgi:LytR cell envelope-related transcriptional attenuator
VHHPAAELPTSQHWRTAALIAAAVAAIELRLLAFLALAAAGDFFSGQVEKATDPTTVTRAAVAREQQRAAGGKRNRVKPPLPRGDTSVLVLNGNGVTGAASIQAQLVQAKRYRITGTGDAPHTDFPRSVVMYRPGFAREARRLARDFRVTTVTPLDGLRPRDLQGAHLTLIVGG